MQPLGKDQGEHESKEIEFLIKIGQRDSLKSCNG
jgi:hypothetical protein